MIEPRNEDTPLPHGESTGRFQYPSLIAQLKAMKWVIGAAAVLVTGGYSASEVMHRKAISELHNRVAANEDRMTAKFLDYDALATNAKTEHARMLDGLELVKGSLGDVKTEIREMHRDQLDLARGLGVEPRRHQR